jgi:hypothetical protein
VVMGCVPGSAVPYRAGAGLPIETRCHTRFRSLSSWRAATARFLPWWLSSWLPQGALRALSSRRLGGPRSSTLRRASRSVHERVREVMRGRVASHDEPGVVSRASKA